MATVDLTEKVKWRK